MPETIFKLNWVHIWVHISVFYIFGWFPGLQDLDVFQENLLSRENTGIKFGHRFSREHQLAMQILQLRSLGGGTVRPRCKPLPLPCDNCSVLNFKLGVQANYPLTPVFLFHTLATAFPTSYHMKTASSCWVWKWCNDACPLYIMHFIIHSTLFDYNFPFLKLH